MILALLVTATVLAGLGVLLVRRPQPALVPARVATVRHPID